MIDFTDHIQSRHDSKRDCWLYSLGKYISYGVSAKALELYNGDMTREVAHFINHTANEILSYHTKEAAKMFACTFGGEAVTVKEVQQDLAAYLPLSGPELRVQ